MVNIQFNKSYVQGEQVDELSPMAYELVRFDNGNINGNQIGSILYWHYVENLSFKEIKELHTGVPFTSIQSICNGKINNSGYLIFIEMLQNEPGVLDRMFST